MVFIGSIPILTLALILFALVFAGARALINMLPILFCILIVKDLIVDFGFGLIKNRKNIFLIILFFILDLLRTALFFYMMYLQSLEYSGFFGIIDFLLFLVLGGILFLIGDFTSLTHGINKQNLGNNSPILIVGDIITLLLLTGMYFLFFM